ncbi:DNA-binding helix-turn-helix protein [Enterococcus faecalis ATCC 29200]|uniref:helix-turn-helix transcriptional regulator n=1 Tax=Enterococcus faecalis TaxID=1351 RepID=UPI00019F6BA1|nr:helix-turn-helix transcriptional regulator [Enterococcus faecalis]EEN70392.1 DNA-binding helix-turn-helix protein [Enterococcus faecalis ATCC 29200]EOJ05964.1 CopS protein [Enterococcus faecalis ATCC 29200]HDT7989500.1 helix-turn-helix transcriptional regulator [Enterococcus faecalis]HDT8070280.1 helix-turn-helix transcriptional regulator [Enterococcus faecalis]
MDMAFREKLIKLRGTKTITQFAKEIGMSKSNYSLIESGKSNPTLKTLQRIAELTQSTLVVDLIIDESEQLELEIEDK